MNITNKYGLPEVIVEAVKYDDYSKGDANFSVTQLLNPPQQEYLKSQHQGELAEDVSDRIWALLGSSVHSILERIGKSMEDKRKKYNLSALDRIPECEVEKRYFTEIDGIKVSGQLDLLEKKTATINDFKVTSVWSVKDAMENGKSYWNTQLNFLAVLLDDAGIPVEQARIIAICRDWSKNGGLMDKNYPQQVESIEIPLLPRFERRLLLKERVQLHKKAREGVYAPCSADEMWEKPSTYALMKEGRKSALRVLPTEKNLMEWAKQNGHSTDTELKKGICVEFRPGKRVRCEDYCSVSKFCKQYQKYKGDNEAEDKVG